MASPFGPVSLCHRCKCEALANRLNMVPEELVTKARCVSHSVAFVSSQTGRTRVRVYMAIGLMGGFPSRQVPDSQELGGCLGPPG